MNSDMLLEGMQCVMRARDRWAARAKDCQQYAFGMTPFEAMMNAEELKLRIERGRVSGYCPVGGNCSNHTECDGSCSPYVGPAAERALPRRSSLFDENDVPVRRRKITE